MLNEILGRPLRISGGRVSKPIEAYMLNFLLTKLGKNGAPGEGRTHDLQLRRLSLYPSELRAHSCVSSVAFQKAAVRLAHAKTAASFIILTRAPIPRQSALRHLL
jgi:hypothetical protein